MSTLRPAFPSAWPSQRATAWRLRSQGLPVGRLPLVMGILNVTPDSFSDGGKFVAHERAIEQGLRLAAEGADLLDIGGESTRPYSSPVAADEELRRVLPVVRGLVRQTRVPLSIDTSKADVARACLDEGVEVVNDVTGLAGDPALLPLVVQSQCGVCAMHMQGTPQTMQDNPQYNDVVADVAQWLRQRRDFLLQAGVLEDRLALDPGIGFGKTHEQNLALLANCRPLLELGRPVLMGHSRKGFIARVLGDKQADRTPGTIGVALALARQGVHIVRVHDVGPVRQALMLFAATGGLDEPGANES